VLQDKVEILPVQLLNTERVLVEEMRRVSEGLNVGLGWHYLLDLTWTANQLGTVSDLQIMDAGAAVGVMQWWLAAQGMDVLSVDQLNRASLPRRFRAWCPVQGLCARDLKPLSRPGVKAFLPPRRLQLWHLWPRKIGSAIFNILARAPMPPEGRGTVTLYNHDLISLPDIKANSLDTVVSISALEHNSPEKLRGVVQEVMRVLKPGGKLIATLGAAKDQDWFHEPSKGWCYTEETLRGIFELNPDCPSNHDQYDELFEALCSCTELRDNLAEFYFKSGNNGMPWGKWDPRYQPVGVVKEKPLTV
jgi:SAM-dependent methyltransferase